MAGRGAYLLLTPRNFDVDREDKSAARGPARREAKLRISFKLSEEAMVLDGGADGAARRARHRRRASRRGNYRPLKLLLLTQLFRRHVEAHLKHRAAHRRRLANRAAHRESSRISLTSRRGSEKRAHLRRKRSTYSVSINRRRCCCAGSSMRR